MPNPLTYYVSQTRSLFNDAYWDFGNFAGYVRQAGIKLQASDWVGAGDDLYDSYLDAMKFVLKLHSVYTYSRYYIIDALEWIDDNWPIDTEPVVVDMESILAAMLVATPDEVKYFIGLVDAYRSSIWNRPFNKDFYAALSRGFEQWE